MKCNFCSYEIINEADICPKCKLDNSYYYHYELKSQELINKAIENIHDQEYAIELLKHSLILQNKNKSFEKLFALLYMKEGKYNHSLKYLKDYPDSPNDSEAINLKNLIIDWKNNLNKILKVSF